MHPLISRTVRCPLGGDSRISRNGGSLPPSAPDGLGALTRQAMIGDRDMVIATRAQLTARNTHLLQAGAGAG